MSTSISSRRICSMYIFTNHFKIVSIPPFVFCFKVFSRSIQFQDCIVSSQLENLIGLYIFGFRSTYFLYGRMSKSLILDASSIVFNVLSFWFLLQLLTQVNVWLLFHFFVLIFFTVVWFFLAFGYIFSIRQSSLAFAITPRQHV